MLKVNFSLILILFGACIFTKVAKSQSTPNFQWAGGAGGTGNDVAFATDIDDDGNVYQIGYFNGTVDFDFGSGTKNHASNGSEDIFVSKYDSKGNFIWAFNIGGTGSDVGYSLKLDKSKSHIVVVGWFSKTVDFDPSNNQYSIACNGVTDIFCAKYDTAGAFVWANSFGSTDWDLGYAIDLDKDDNIYLTGSFKGTVDFDPSASSANRTSNGAEDIFISKYDKNGNYLWAINMGGGSADGGYGIAVDTAQNVYLAGQYKSKADFDPSTGNTYYLNSNGGLDFCIAKYDVNGDFIWANSFGGTSDDAAIAIRVDVRGKVYVTGSFQGTTDFDPGNGTQNYTASGGRDSYLASFYTDGSYNWVDVMGGSGDDFALNLYLTNKNSISLTGFYSSTVDFDPSNNASNISSNGGKDIFFCEYDTSGNFSWVEGIGSSSDDYGFSIQPDAKNGFFYIGGYYGGTTDFDPSNNTSNKTCNGGIDIYLAKYSNCKASSVSVNDTICSSAGFQLPDGSIVKTAGTYSTTIQNTLGCDSVITTTLYDNTTSSNLNLNFCSGTTTKLPDGTQVSVAGNYTSIIPNFVGCDSVITIILTEIKPYSAKVSAQFCQGSYYVLPGGDTAFQSGTYIDSLTGYYGCDSVITTMLSTNPTYTTKVSATVCDGTTYYLPDGSPVKTAGVYSTTFSTIYGCDSVIYTYLSLYPKYSISQQGFICKGTTYVLPDGSTVSQPGQYTSQLLSINGCDSIIITDVIDNTSKSSVTASICNGNVYILPDGNQVTSAGTYTSTISNILGCDSVISIKLNVFQPFSSSSVVSICNGSTYTLPSGNIVSTAGTYIDSFLTTNGCDSIISTKINIKPTYFNQVSITLCSGQSYTLPNGQIVSSAGSYTSKLSTYEGCDSTIQTDVNVNPSYSLNAQGAICEGGTYYLPDGKAATTAGSYVSNLITTNGCDSIITTQLIVYPSYNKGQNIHVCDGSSYTLPDGKVVSTTGNYSSTLYTVNGCDSVINTNLIVDALPAVPSVIGSNNVSAYQTVNYSVQSVNGYSYNWTVTGGNIISGQGTNYVGVQWGNAGTGTLSITNTNSANCSSDTTINITIGFAAGISTVNPFENITLFPNPTKDLLTVKLGTQTTFGYQILDMQGRSVVTGNKLIGDMVKINTEALAPGVYLIRLTEQNHDIHLKFVKE